VASEEVSDGARVSSQAEAAATDEAVDLVEVNNPCCICGSTASKPLFTKSYKKKKVVAPMHMRCCLGCGLIFCSPRVSEDRIADYYDSSYYVFKRPDADYFLKSADIYNRTIKLASPMPDEIVEIGSGKGYLLALLKDLGWRVQGIEIADAAAAFARETLGVPTYCGTTDTFVESDAKRTFPVIACIDVIEHVPDPPAFVASLTEISEAGSLLVIDTPNGDAAHIEARGAEWRGFNPYHIYFFNRHNLTDLLERNGFLVLQTFTYNNTPEPVRNPPPHHPDGTPLSDAEARAAAVARCRESRDYFETADARETFAVDRRGENLVVIAVRRPDASLGTGR